MDEDPGTYSDLELVFYQLHKLGCPKVIWLNHIYMFEWSTSSYFVGPGFLLIDSFMAFWIVPHVALSLHPLCIPLHPPRSSRRSSWWLSGRHLWTRTRTESERAAEGDRDYTIPLGCRIHIYVYIYIWVEICFKNLMQCGSFGCLYICEYTSIPLHNIYLLYKYIIYIDMSYI